MPDYPKEQLWELYKNLPPDLQTTIFSPETADKIYGVCTRNGIEETEEISAIAKYVGYVLLGVLPPDELQLTLEKESDLGLKKNLVKQIAWEISRFVFLPIKDTLEALYKTELARSITAPETASSTSDTSASLKEEKGKKTKDTYREPIT